jgi:hypothetical protein
MTKVLFVISAADRWTLNDKMSWGALMQRP